MAAIHNYTVEALKALKGLVGEIVFEAAVKEVLSPIAEKHVHFAPTAVMNTGETVPVVAPVIAVVPEKKRTRKITEEQRTVVARNMAALQAFTKSVKGEFAEGTPYKDIKKAAGERWRALSKEERDRWAPNVAPPPNDIICSVCSDPIVDASEHKACLKKVIDEGKKSGKTTDESIRSYMDASGAKLPLTATGTTDASPPTPLPEKKGRGRPKKNVVSTYVPSVTVNRLSKTETDAVEETGELPGFVE